MATVKTPRIDEYVPAEPAGPERVAIIAASADVPQPASDSVPASESWEDSFGTPQEREASLVASERFGFVPRTILDFSNDDRWQLSIPKELMAAVEHRRSFAFKSLNGKAMTATNFNSGLARFLLKYYTVPGDRILDPFAGWGTRAHVARLLGRQYTGYDVAASTVIAVADALKRVEQMSLDGAAIGTAEVILGDGVKCAGQADASFDALLTCPPYHDRELYEDAPADIGPQLSRVGREDFERAMRNGFSRWHALLKPGALAIFVVGDWRDRGDWGEDDEGVRHKAGYYPFAFKMQSWAFAAGFEMHDFAVHRLRSLAMRGVGSFMKSRILPRTHEYVLVFRRGGDE